MTTETEQTAKEPPAEETWSQRYGRYGDYTLIYLALWALALAGLWLTNIDTAQKALGSIALVVALFGGIVIIGKIRDSH